MWRLTQHIVRNRLDVLDGEEVFNSITHAAALGAAAVGAFLLMGVAAFGGDLWRITGAAIYGASLVFLYAASTVYHGVVGSGVKAFFRRMDHLGIKLLIAGSYTPFILAHLRDGPGLWLGFIVWGFVALGVVMQLAVPARLYYRLSLLLYLGMGFACVPFASLFLEALPPGALLLLILGGGTYVLGVVFYVWKRLPYSHGIWHLFVIGGSAFHFAAILRYAVLAP